MKSIDSFLQENPNFQLIEGSKKVKCRLSGHEISQSELQSYLNGSKYQRLAKLKTILDEYTDCFQPVGDRLKCLVTGRILSRDPKSLENHVNGAKFQRKFAEFKSRQIDGSLMETESNGVDNPSDNEGSLSEYPEFLDDSDEIESEGESDDNFNTDELTSAVGSKRKSVDNVKADKSAKSKKRKKN